MKSRTVLITSLLTLALGLAVAMGATAPGSPVAAAPSVTTAPAAATASASGLYRVELIIFRHTAPTGSEDFNAPPEGRGFSGRQDSGGTAPRVARLLETSELQMNSTAAALRANAGMQLLAHAGWLQTATNWPRHIGLPLEQLGINVEGLTGNLYLERGELLHFGADLRLGSNPVYALSELRKLRFNERHYLDNPAFGIIVQVSPTRSSAP
jgi:Peptidoglycan-binding protein, CsiV